MELTDWIIVCLIFVVSYILFDEWSAAFIATVIFVVVFEIGPIGKDLNEQIDNYFDKEKTEQVTE